MLYEDYLNLNPLEFTRAVSFIVDWKHESALEEREMRIEMVLRHKDDNSRLMKIRFSQVSRLKLNGTLGYNTGLGTVLVKDITDRQWSWPYNVIETEDEGFEFYCHNFEAVVVTL